MRAVILFAFPFSFAGHLRLSLALDGDGVEIFSANEVCRFLCSETGNEGFYGTDPTHQALVDYWLGWEAGELKVHVHVRKKMNTMFSEAGEFDSLVVYSCNSQVQIS